MLSKEKKIIPISHPVDSKKLLDGKIVLITGGSGGIGMAIARKFIESGAKVIIAGTNDKKLKECCELLGDNARAVVINMLNVASFKEKVNSTSQIFGKIDILVSAVGIHANYKGLDFLNVNEEQYDLIMDTNLKGAYFFCQEITKYFIDNKVKGHILFISSQSALEPAWSPYRLSKHGIDEITKGIAQRVYQYGIVVNGIGPGPTATSMQPYQDGDSIYTDQNPIRRYTMPDEIAEYAKLLVSELGDTIIGDTIYMSGGRGIIEIR